jgi:hypothetical protein
MIEYRTASLDRALRVKGYHYFAIHCFRVMGQASWQIEITDREGMVIRLVGGGAVRYDEVQAHIAALPDASPPLP